MEKHETETKPRIMGANRDLLRQSLTSAVNKGKFKRYRDGFSYPFKFLYLQPQYLPDQTDLYHYDDPYHPTYSQHTYPMLPTYQYQPTYADLVPAPVPVPVKDVIVYKKKLHNIEIIVKLDIFRIG